MRCRAVLLKSTGLTSEQVGEQTDMTHISVNSWVKRFETEGIKGLETRPGETLWRILKGKLLRPADYCSTYSLLYATNRALAALGSELNINFAMRLSIN